MKMPDLIVCPFCGEDDFDLIGLKIHLICYCEVFLKTPIRDDIGHSPLDKGGEDA